MHLTDFLNIHVSTWGSIEFDLKCMERFEYSGSILPKNYLLYAQDDLESTLPHKHINALSNAKRAIDCQLDNICDAFGLRKQRNFPQKMELIGEIGLVAPRIVRKVIRVRNLLEHEYYDPDDSETEDAVDVATLFLEATARPFRSFMEDYFVADGASVQNGAERMVSSVLDGENPINGYTFTESFFVSYEQKDNTFWIDCVHNNQLVEEIEISPNHPFYIRMVRFAFENDPDYHNHSDQEIAKRFVGLMRELANEI